MPKEREHSSRARSTCRSTQLVGCRRPFESRPEKTLTATKNDKKGNQSATKSSSSIRGQPTTVSMLAMLVDENFVKSERLAVAGVL